MKKIIVTAVLSALVLTGCVSGSDPEKTVTVTQTAPAPSLDDGVVVNNEEIFLDFVREYGGPYARAATRAQLIDLGQTICSAVNQGLSEDEITYAMSGALVKSGMDNDNGVKLAAALIVGSKKYLCGSPTF